MLLTTSLRPTARSIGCWASSQVMRRITVAFFILAACSTSIVSASNILVNRLPACPTAVLLAVRRAPGTTRAAVARAGRSGFISPDDVTPICQNGRTRPVRARTLGRRTLARWMLDMHFHVLPRNVQFNSLHNPEHHRSKKLPVRIHAVNRKSSLMTMRDSVVLSHRDV